MAHVRTYGGEPLLVDNWYIADVHQAAEDMGITVTDSEAEDILIAIAESFDANIGINWEVFYHHLEDYRKD